jgi:hypothetical protein
MDNIIKAFQGSVENIKAPKCVFKPSLNLMRTMIKAILKFGNSDSDQTFFLRFGLLYEHGK